MAKERAVPLSIDAAAALRQVLGIMLDQGYGGWDWDLSHVAALDSWFESLWDDDEWRAMVGDERSVRLHIEDVALLLEGMAFTEAASAELPWIDMVRWTADFVAAQLRPYWTEDEWRDLAARTSS